MFARICTVKFSSNYIAAGYENSAIKLWNLSGKKFTAPEEKIASRIKLGCERYAEEPLTDDKLVLKIIL